MNKYQLKTLIRETVYQLLEETKEFSEGDKIVTSTGEEGDITLVKHPFYAVTLDDTGITKSYHVSDLKGLDTDKSDNKFYGKYDVNPKKKLQESSVEDIIIIEGILTIDEEKSQLTDILSSIRSLSGITVVRNEEIKGPKDKRNYKTKLTIKIDPYPYIKQKVSTDKIPNILLNAIKQIMGVKGFFSLN